MGELPHSKLHIFIIQRIRLSVISHHRVNQNESTVRTKRTDEIQNHRDLLMRTEKAGLDPVKAQIHFFPFRDIGRASFPV